MNRKLKYRIEKTVKWEASHRLVGLPADHQCSRLHGHSYSAKITLSSYEVDDVGFVIDFGILGKMVKDVFDHRHLNEVMPVNPTAENIAAYMVEIILSVLFKMQVEKYVRLESVRVYETETSWAEVVVEETP